MIEHEDVSQIPIAKLRWNDLQKECKRFSLSAKGTRPELEKRLSAKREPVGDEVPETLLQQDVYMDKQPGMAAGNAVDLAEALKSSFPGDAKPSGEISSPAATAKKGRGRLRKAEEQGHGHEAASVQVAPVPADELRRRRLRHNWLAFSALLLALIGTSLRPLPSEQLLADLSQQTHELGSIIKSMPITRKLRSMAKGDVHLHSQPQCSRQLDAAAAAMGQLVSQEAWAQDPASQFMDLLRGAPLNSAKASSVLLVAKGPSISSKAIGTILAALPPTCLQSHIHLLGGHWQSGAADNAGKLQALLSEVLVGSPYAVILIEDVDQFSPDALVVLINLMGEHGQLIHNGHTLPAHHALFILTAQLPSVPTTMVSAEEHDHSAKDALERKLAGRGSIRTAHDVTATIKAFRRRIDLVVPLTEATDGS